MTSAELTALLDIVKVGDILGYHVDPTNAGFSGLPSVLTELGGELCHVEIVAEKIYDTTGKCIDLNCIVADGTEVCYHTFVTRLNPLDIFTIFILEYEGCTQEQRGQMLELAITEAWETLVYNWDIIEIIGTKQAETEIPIVGFFFNKFVWTTPPSDGKELPGTICSKSVTKYIRSVFPTFMKGYWIDYITPSAIFNCEDISIYKP
jgi:hypothetical protein